MLKYFKADESIMLEALIANPYFVNAVIVIASLYILFKSADLMVFGITNYAKKLGLSDYLIGLVVIAMAASAPEVIASIMGLQYGDSGIVFGAIIGSNMVHMALAVGVLAVVGRRINVECKILDKALFPLWIMLMLPFVLSADGVLSRPDGLILIGLFVAYLIFLWRQEGTFGKIKKRVMLKSLWRDAFVFLGCLVALLLAGRWLVFGAVNLANLWALTPYFISLTVIGIGTTIPDFAIELRSLFRKHEAIGLGDILGSLIIELVLYFGILSLIRPLVIDFDNVLTAAIFLIGSISFILYIIKHKVLTWKHGIVLLGIYAAFLGVELFKIV